MSGEYNIFLSMPTELSEKETETVHKISEVLKCRGIKLRTIGVTDFTNETPMEAIKEIMEQCTGAIILGFTQIKVEKGIKKPETKKEMALECYNIATPWNQIEAAMAYMLDLPLFIIKDNGIDGGIFDPGVTSKFIHEFDLKEQGWLETAQFLQPFNKWYEDVIRKSSK